MSGLLRPGAHRAAGVADDEAVAAALLRVETAWAGVLASIGVVTADQTAVVATTAETLDLDVSSLAQAAEAAGNPVVPLVGLLRDAVAEVDASAVAAVHRGLTSQDVLDTALMLLTRDALARVRQDLIAVGTAVAGLARDHRDTVMAGRTLTQWAVPTTFGLKAAQWLAGITDAVRRIDALVLPVQYGGAAGTRALLASLTATDQCDVADAFAAALELAPARLPWHTRRSAVTAAGDALVVVTDALGVVAGDVLLLGRPEVAEVREGGEPGRGGSSTMPHKQNPVLAVLVAAAAQQTPLLAAQLHLAAAGAVDERPPGAWHAEWPALARLLELVVTAASQAAELVTGLEVDAEAMARRAEAAARELLAERGEEASDTDVRGYLGNAGDLVDEALTGWEALVG